MDYLTNLLSDNIMLALGWTFIHILWKGTLVAFGLFVLLLILRKQTAKLRYFISTLSLLLVLILAISDFSNYIKPQDSTNQINLEVYSNTKNTAALPSETITGNFLVKLIKSDFQKYFPYMVIFWMIGILFHFIKLCGGFLYIKRITRHNKNSVSPEWLKRITLLKEKVGINKIVRTIQSKYVKTPVIIGYLKPIILLPIGLLSSLPTEQIEAIIAHELAHIKRHDYIVNIIQSVIEVLFFFHPTIWYISAKIRQEREHCCDDIAIDICGESLAYAKALANVQKLSPENHSIAMAFSGKKNQLLNRIKRMLMKPKIKSNFTDKIWSVVIILLAIGILTASAGNTFNHKKDAAIVAKKTPKKKDQVKEKDLMLIKEDTAKNKQIKIIKHLKHNDDLDDNEHVVIRKTHDSNEELNEDIKMKFKDGEISELWVNGEKIPKDEYENYQVLINDTKVDIKKVDEEKELIEIERHMIEKELEEIEEEKLEQEFYVQMIREDTDEDEEEKILIKIKKELDNIDWDEIRMEIEHAHNDLDEADLEKINLKLELDEDIDHLHLEESIKIGIEAAQKALENIDWKSINDDIKVAIKVSKDATNIDIDIDDLKESLKDLEEIEIEEGRKPRKPRKPRKIKKLKKDLKEIKERAEANKERVEQEKIEEMMKELEE